MSEIITLEGSDCEVDGGGDGDGDAGKENQCQPQPTEQQRKKKKSPAVEEKVVDCMESLLSSMASAFNADCATGTAESSTLLDLDLAEDKTLKWRNLANNQFACKERVFGNKIQKPKTQDGDATENRSQPEQQDEAGKERVQNAGGHSTTADRDSVAALTLSTAASNATSDAAALLTMEAVVENEEKQEEDVSKSDYENITDKNLEIQKRVEAKQQAAVEKVAENEQQQRQQTADKVLPTLTSAEAATEALLATAAAAAEKEKVNVGVAEEEEAAAAAAAEKEKVNVEVAEEEEEEAAAEKEKVNVEVAGEEAAAAEKEQVYVEVAEEEAAAPAPAQAVDGTAQMNNSTAKDDSILPKAEDLGHDETTVKMTITANTEPTPSLSPPPVLVVAVSDNETQNVCQNPSQETRDMVASDFPLPKLSKRDHGRAMKQPAEQGSRKRKRPASSTSVDVDAGTDSSVQPDLLADESRPLRRRSERLFHRLESSATVNTSTHTITGATPTTAEECAIIPTSPTDADIKPEPMDTDTGDSNSNSSTAVTIDEPSTSTASKKRIRKTKASQPAETADAGTPSYCSPKKRRRLVSTVMPVSPILASRPKRLIKPTEKIRENAKQRDARETNTQLRQTNNNKDQSSGKSAKKITNSIDLDVKYSQAALAARKALKKCPDIDKFLDAYRATARKPVEMQLPNKHRQLTKKVFMEMLSLKRVAPNDIETSTDSDEIVPRTHIGFVEQSHLQLRKRNSNGGVSPQKAALNRDLPSTSKKAKTQVKPKSKAPVKRKSGPQQQPLAIVASPDNNNVFEVAEDQLQSFNAALLANELPDHASRVNSTQSNGNPENRSLICLCEQKSPYYSRRLTAVGESSCCAIDDVNKRRVGCFVVLSHTMQNLRRPSKSVSYRLLCDEHKRRLETHTCCPTCGLFCTHGNYILCKNRHFFHANCAESFVLNRPAPNPAATDTQTSAARPSRGRPILALSCPHCGSTTPKDSSTVTMELQSPLNYLPTKSVYITPTDLSANIAELGGRLPILHTINDIVTNGNNHLYNNNIGANNSNDNNCRSSRNSTRASTSTNSHTTGLSVASPFQQQNWCDISFEHLVPDSIMSTLTRGLSQIQSNGHAGQLSTDFTTSDLYYSVLYDDLERVSEILATDYDLAQRMPKVLNGTCLHLVASSGTLSMCYLLLYKFFGRFDFINAVDDDLRTAAMCAVMNNNCGILHLLLQCGADITYKGPEGKTTLHIAAKLGNIEATKLIVTNYRSAQSTTKFLELLNTRDDGGWTAMVWAAELNHTDIVSLFLNNGANPNICDNNNNTALHWAALHNDGISTTSLLLGAGIDPNVQNIEGDTPLHIACRHSIARLANILIRNGADILVKNKCDQMPYDCIEDKQSECARCVGFQTEHGLLRPLRTRTSLVCGDVSNGRELRPIQAKRNELMMSETDDESAELLWPDFKYITKSIISLNSIRIDQRVSQMRICSCLDGCIGEQCQCIGASTQNYYTIEGRLIAEFNFEDPAVIFECNDVCGCNKLSCMNRVVQNGVRIPMQIKECNNSIKGWGVFALNNIPKGSFVANYTGELLTAAEAGWRTDNSYYYELGGGYCIDANYFGNITRFLNHSCEPNIVAVRVFYEHQDYRFPKIAFFTCRDIRPGEELCYDYGDKFWNGTLRKFNCHCKAPKCRFATSNGSSASMPSIETSASTPPLLGFP